MKFFDVIFDTYMAKLGVERTSQSQFTGLREDKLCVQLSQQKQSKYNDQWIINSVEKNLLIKGFSKTVSGELNSDSDGKNSSQQYYSTP